MNGTSSNAWVTMARALMRSWPARSPGRMTPIGRVAVSPTRPASSRTSSSEPPPRSPSTPSAAGMPHSTPSAASAASAPPDRMVMRMSGISAIIAATNSWPFSASRTAEVASTSNGAAPMARAMAA